MPKLAANSTMMFNEVPFLERFPPARRRRKCAAGSGRAAAQSGPACFRPLSCPTPGPARYVRRI